MQGSPTIKLGRLFGIRIGVSAVWFLVLFVVIWYLDGYFKGVLAGGTEAFLVAVVAALLFFATVVAHEFGHALVARRLGMTIDGVDLWALGGFTRTRGAPETPGAEFALAAGGPVVNVLVVAICAVVAETCDENRPVYGEVLERWRVYRRRRAWREDDQPSETAIRAI